MFQLLILDGDIASLQRELKEKELDITHLHKEIQELQLENKLLKAKGPSVYSNGYTNV
jgi:peptidoglycan hydrolase CwlO-like protein